MNKEDLILWASADPRYKTGYGQQTAIWTRKLRDEGYRIEIASMGGLRGAPSEWEGITVWPVDTFVDLITLYRRRGAKLMIGLRDFWNMNAELLGQANIRLAFWMPIDCDPLDISDFAQLNASNAYPIAMSRFGARMLRGAGVEQFLYVPHGIDTSFWTPAEDPEEARAKAGIPPDVFVIGINATNIDAQRKGWYEQMEAFSMFYKEHPDSLLLLHTITDDEGTNLEYMAYVLGIEQILSTTDQWMLKQGLIGQNIMRQWYRTIHILSNCSWAEGFGIPIIEAQSCGVPTVVTNFASMPELVPYGWHVEGELKWNASHNGRWKSPNSYNICEAYEEAYRMWKENPGRFHGIQKFAREHAVKYDVNRVYNKFWRPALEALFKGRTVIFEAAGLKWKVDIDNTTSDGLGAAHETAVEQVVLSLIPKGGVFLDVGAHVGHYTLRASQIASKVLAVEANPDTMKRLRENLELNSIKNVDTFGVAAWDEVTELSLFSPNDAIRDGSTRVLDKPGGDIAACPLDNLLTAVPRIDLIKLDVEGADLHALRGMRGLIDDHKPIMFIEDHSIYDYYDRKDLEALIDELGYDWTHASDFGGNAPYLIARPRELSR